MAVFDDYGIGVSDRFADRGFVLAQELAEKFHQLAKDTMDGESEKLVAIRRLAQFAAALEGPRFPRAVIVDRVQAVAEANGLFLLYDVDAVQQAIADGFGNPIYPEGMKRSWAGESSRDSRQSEKVTLQKSRITCGLLTVLAAEVDPKRVQAIWTDCHGGVRLARGEHTLIAGEPGLGKSQVVLYLAAAISRGGNWPGGEGHAPSGSVVILASEDSIEHTLVPRLIAAGADLNRVHFVQAAVADDGCGRRGVNFQSDFAKLRQLVTAIPDVVLVIIDPLTAYMGRIDSHKNAEVRGVLSPIGELASECKVAIASITHFTKGNGKYSAKAIDRIIGSIAFVAAPRIGLTVVADPDDHDRRLLLHVKNNLSRRPQGLAFRIEQRVVGQDENGEFTASCLAWESIPIEISADDALGEGAKHEPTATDDAVEFLGQLLSAGPQKVLEIEVQARAAGLLSDDRSIGQNKAFRLARNRLGIKPYQMRGETHGGWFWALPNDLMPSQVSGALH